MENIISQIIETWRIHQRILSRMIDHIPEEAMKASLSKRGGRNIARQLAHLQNVRVTRLKSFARRNNENLVEYQTNDEPNVTEIKEALEQSSKIMEKYMENAIQQNGNVSNFKRGLVPMLGYYISHESHHRGNILLTMKQNGFTLPDQLKWGIWEWNKI